jgi:REP element-mobilizing transposase RayT
MTLYKNRYRIESTRLIHWDYSSPAWYFVTICTKDRACLLGTIDDGSLRLSRAGRIVAEEWPRTKSVWPGVGFDQFVVMPNHVHGIVILKDAPQETRLRGVSTRGVLQRPTLGDVMRQFKSRATTRIWTAGFKNFGWQPRFHDRIIRGERDLTAIREYIANNPAKWALDKENPANFR